MNQADYLKDRVDDQIAWYGKKSNINKKYHLWSNGMIITFSALIPFFTGMIGGDCNGNADGTNGMWLPFTIAGLGVFTAVSTGISALLKFQEKWTTYRLTAEALQREKILFQTGTSPYDKSATSFKIFVLNMENLMSSENNQWQQAITSSEGDGQ